MTDWLSREQRSRNMASIRSAGNKTTELVMMELLRGLRISGWRRHLPLPGRPDFVFPKARIAVFIDGCFWHQCPHCYDGHLPKGNRSYWKTKLQRNVVRDRAVNRVLRQNKWAVFRVWECSLSNRKAALFNCLDALARSLEKQA